MVIISDYIPLHYILIPLHFTAILSPNHSIPILVGFTPPPIFAYDPTFKSLSSPMPGAKFNV